MRLENLQKSGFIGDRVLEIEFASFENAFELWSAVRTPSALIEDCVVCFERVGVYFRVPPRSIDEALETLVAAVEEAEVHRTETHEIPVLYGGEGLDLESAAAILGTGVDSLVQAHERSEFICQGVGFSPGFPYLVGLDKSAHGLKRKDNPRAVVPVGSVAVVDDLGCVYPTESPGGWWLIGRTPIELVSVADGYFPIRPGDGVRFRRVDRGEFDSLRGERL